MPTIRSRHWPSNSTCSLYERSCAILPCFDAWPNLQRILDMFPRYDRNRRITDYLSVLQDRLARPDCSYRDLMTAWDSDLSLNEVIPGMDGGTLGISSRRRRCRPHPTGGQ
jgi:hypothetical protein